ncbi:MAG: hypothetical protein ABI067_07140, partial [Leifsonia sp.]
YDLLFGGASGGGKTKGLIMDALAVCQQYPGLRAAIFRRTYDEHKESVIPELASVGFGEALGGKWNATASELTFPNGSLIRLRHLEQLADASRRQGGNYQYIGFEERTLLVPQAADQVAERMRTREGSGIPVIGIRCTSNPGGASHGEVKSKYIEPTGYGERVIIDEFGHSIRFIPARVGDNPHIDAGYLRVLDAIPDPARRKAMRDGDWTSFSGQVFVTFSRDRHVVTPWLLPASWHRYCGIDYGHRAPWAVLWGAEDEDGRLWVYRALHEVQVGEHDQARRILAAEAGGRAASVDADGRRIEVAEPPSWRSADPAMWAKRGDAESIAAAYADEGCFIEPANNDRLSGWQRIHTYLAEAPACAQHRAMGWETCPMLHIFSGCVDLIRTLPNLPYDQKRVEDVDTNADDHDADALRYLCLSVGVQAGLGFGGGEERPTTWREDVTDPPEPYRATGDPGFVVREPEY